MAKGCKWNKGDIPDCPTAKVEIPTDLITWVEAVRIHNKMKNQNVSYKYDAYIWANRRDKNFSNWHPFYKSGHKQTILKYIFKNPPIIEENNRFVSCYSSPYLKPQVVKVRRCYN